MNHTEWVHLVEYQWKITRIFESSETDALQQTIHVVRCNPIVAREDAIDVGISDRDVRIRT